MKFGNNVINIVCQKSQYSSRKKYLYIHIHIHIQYIYTMYACMYVLLYVCIYRQENIKLFTIKKCI